MLPEIDIIEDHIRKKFGCHTLILYGSVVHGTQKNGSDIDLVGIIESGSTRHITDTLIGANIDLFLYPEEILNPPPVDLIRIRTGKVLFEKEQFGRQLIQNVGEVFSRGPKPLSSDEQNLKRNWILKTLNRINHKDIESNYRRVELLAVLLEDYFLLRQLWYLGPKEAFDWLKTHDPMVFNLFEKALDNTRSNRNIESLAHAVIPIP